MPAYRSSAEAEVRTAVVERLRQRRADARIIHEINVSGEGSNRIDVLAVSPSEIIAIEIKSAKDKLDRLPMQIQSMRGCAHHVVAVLHEKFLVEQETNPGAAHCERDGKYFLKRLPDGVSLHSSRCLAWVYPEVRRAMPGAGFDPIAVWEMPNPRVEEALPAGAIDMLWRDELAWLCGSLGVAAGRRSTMPEMIAALRWHCNGRELTRGICAALRRRECIEADPAVAA